MDSSLRAFGFSRLSREPTLRPPSYLRTRGCPRRTILRVRTSLTQNGFRAYPMLIVFEGADREIGWFQLVKVVRPVSRPVLVIWMG
jgi:hypothetical protein